MKLLIVDDEKLTREGLISSVDWESLGISQVFEADDGLNGLRVADEEKPEMILCDVRMPRMDGIRMAERLKEMLPDSAVIFMSGYSDKEYLKAAIKLKAVSYVEKPLNPKEIREAVLEAKERIELRLRTRRGEAFHSLEAVSALALALTRPYREQREAITAMTEELALHLTSGDGFTTYLAHLSAPVPDTQTMTALRGELEDFLKRFHLQVLYVFKHDSYHVFHLYGASQPSETALTQIDQRLAKLCQPLGAFFVARGESVTGISRAYQSYASAVTLMQSSFFFDSGRVLTPSAKGQEGKESSLELLHTVEDAFLGALLAGDRETCEAALGQLFSACYENRSFFPHPMKDLYYKLFMALREDRQKFRLIPDGDGHSIMEYLERCFTLRELHQTLTDGVEDFFAALQTHPPEDSTILLIKEFIGRHYSEATLSVREISEHVFLSASYVCTYFKNETGQTLNQYLTEYRIEKAKQLLNDPRNQIADISDRVGYSNGNYFGKSFKKLMGLSPSEYREKMLQ